MRRVRVGPVVLSVALIAAVLGSGSAQAQEAPSITVTPSTGLQDGQSVTVTGSGFSADVADVGLAQCDVPGPDLCIGHTVVAASGGSFSATFTVSRFVLGTDCSVAPGRCALGASNLNGAGGAFVEVDYASLSFATVPGAPTIGPAVAGSGQATVSWTAPAATGGSAGTAAEVTPYIGYYPLPSTTFSSTATTRTVTGLTNGTMYRFRVQAINAVGTGPYSKVSNPVSPVAPTVPGAPTIGSATAGNAEATMSWTAPTSNGGSTVTGYVVTPYIGYFPLPSVTCSSTATTRTVIGLTNGTTLRFRVQAINAVGTGAFSKVTNPVTPTGIGPVGTGSIELCPGDRPALLVAPPSVTAPAPLVVLLHGYGTNAQIHNAYLNVTGQAALASRGLYVLLPNGTVDQSAGKRFWDAMPACCNFAGPPVDDVGYLSALIEEAIAVRPIDPDRIYVFGHSNGGFMAYRLACELSDEVTAIAVLAGSDFPTDADCQPSRPVSVLHLHGSTDEVVAYGGGTTFGPPVNIVTSPYPGAEDAVKRWAVRAGCDAPPDVGVPLDLVDLLPGAETTVAAYRNCVDGVDVQLDTIVGGLHSPLLEPASVGIDVLDWLLDHER